jgi:predicted branched-subunit amino acid permease
LVEAMRFLTARRWWPGRSSYAATSVLTDEAYAVVELRIP